MENEVLNMIKSTHVMFAMQFSQKLKVWKNIVCQLMPQTNPISVPNVKKLLQIKEPCGCTLQIPMKKVSKYAEFHDIQSSKKYLTNCLFICLKTH